MAAVFACLQCACSNNFRVKKILTCAPSSFFVRRSAFVWVLVFFGFCIDAHSDSLSRSEILIRSIVKMPAILNLRLEYFYTKVKTLSRKSEQRWIYMLFACAMCTNEIQAVPTMHRLSYLIYLFSFYVPSRCFERITRSRSENHFTDATTIRRRCNVMHFWFSPTYYITAGWNGSFILP